MIPLVLAGVGIGLAAYWLTRTIRHEPVTWKGLLATTLVAGLTLGVGGVALDALWAAGLFATEGAVAGALQDKVVAPVKDVFHDVFDRDAKEEAPGSSNETAKEMAAERAQAAPTQAPEPCPARSVGCAASIEKAFTRNRDSRNTK